MLHNSDPFGLSEAPINMGASVNMTVNPAMNVPNGFMGKSPHETSQSSNVHNNIPSYPHYGYPVMSPHNPMHHFQNFPSNVFQTSFMGHNSPALHDTSWQHGLLPMNLNTHAENASNMNFYERKDFGYIDYKEQSLHAKSVPLNVPQVYSKAYHKEGTGSHPNYHSYQDPSNLRAYDKPYLHNNLDLTMNKTQKPETRSYDLDLSTKPTTLDESRRRSLENTVKMIENILIHNPTSSSSINYPMSQTKNAQIMLSNYNKNMYNEKSESKSMYNERSSSKITFNERTDYKSVSNERTDTKNMYNERLQTKNLYGERAESKNMYERPENKDLYAERLLHKNMYNERPQTKTLYTERPEIKNTYNERSITKNIFTQESDIKNTYSERTATKNIFNEGIDNKNLYNERSDNKNTYIERVAIKNIFNETIDHKNLYNDRLESKNTYNEKPATKIICNEAADNKNMYNERLDRDMYNKRPETTITYNENSTSKNIYNEGSYNKNDQSGYKAIYNEISENRLYNETLAKKDVHEEEINSRNISNSNDANITHNEGRTNAQTKTNDDKDISIAETSKSLDNTKSIYSCSTENSIESEINSDERNNNLTNSPENENQHIINEESSENQIERIEIKVELQSNNSDSDSDDVKPLTEYTSKNPLEEFTDMSLGNGIEVKVENLSSWSDSELSNPFQRDVFGVPKESAVDSAIVEAENSVTAAKEAIGKEAATKTFYECSVCSLYFTSPKRFLIHSKWHGLKLPIERKTEQEMERVMKRNLRKEARKVWKMNSDEITEGTEVTGEVFKCNSCEKMFSTRASLKNHKQRYHPTLVRECLICHKTLVGWQAIKTHRATEHTSLSDSRYQCTDCPKRFKFSHSLVKHRDTHLEKTHPCELCPKKFGSQKLLSTHMKTHERVMRGTTCHCSYCGKGFFESYQLQVHERTHRNERPFLCQICNTSFGTNSSLQRHLKVSHSAAKPYQCSTCRRNFVTEKIRDRHVLRHHGDAESFKFLCAQCPCRYLNQKDLNKHVQKNHPRPGRKRRGRKCQAAAAAGGEAAHAGTVQ